MELTRHFTATVYVVEGGAVPLHRHERIGTWLPPGGHVERDELPHEAGLRETREETGLDVELVADREAITSPTVESLPKPAHLQLADVNTCDGEVGHQHVDLVYYARASDRELEPRPGEAPAEDWEWFGPTDLADRPAVDSDVAGIGRRAIETVGAGHGSGGER